MSSFNEEKYDYWEKYAHLEEEFRQEIRQERQSRRQASSREETLDDLAAAAGMESGWNPTYQPSLYEAEWMLQSLSGFYQQQLITDVVALIKGGKEASVYRCVAHPSTGVRYLAAKIYRPRKFRSLSNDAMYREGRDLLAGDGTRLNASDDREMRAFHKKTGFGRKVAHTSWVSYEYNTLETFHAAGAAVPKPYAMDENAILMSYIGDERGPAPTLNTVRLGRDEAERQWTEIGRNIELMLTHGQIHGDLSAFNILYWEGKITLIDFPQVTDAVSNPMAEAILRRDVRRVCDYIAKQGVPCDAEAFTADLIERYHVHPVEVWVEEPEID